MGRCVEDPPPVKLFFAVMARDDPTIDQAVDALEREFGTVDMQDATYDFDMTDYYEPEFGPQLKKRLVAVERPVRPEALADIKRRTNDMEDQSARDGRRTVNIDPGYVDMTKVVLATTKDSAHRVYVGRGIFEEVTLAFRGEEGGFVAQPWTYPDHRIPGRVAFLDEVRERHRRQRKDAR